jgi:hypothetical protein
MVHSRNSRLNIRLLIACVAIPSINVQAQDVMQQDQSVADAARHNREQKKNVVRRARVISDDDLDREDFRSGREGLNVGAAPTLQTGAPSASVVAAETADKAAIAATREPVPSANETKEDVEIAELKARIAGAEADLDLQRRELALDQDTVYSNPNYSDSHAGKAKLDAQRQKINQRQHEIEGLEAQLVVLQERRKQSAKRSARP